jgi:hypothetical protein
MFVSSDLTFTGWEVLNNNFSVNKLAVKSESGDPEYLLVY